MHKPRWDQPALGVTIASLLLLAGCAENPYMARARQTREQAMERDLQAIAGVQQGRTEMLKQTLHVARDRYERDIQATQRNAEILREWPESEVEHWTKKEPAYRAAIQHQLAGDPDSIERTVPYLIY